MEYFWATFEDGFFSTFWGQKKKRKDCSVCTKKVAKKRGKKKNIRGGRGFFFHVSVIFLGRKFECEYIKVGNKHFSPHLCIYVLLSVGSWRKGQNKLPKNTERIKSMHNWEILSIERLFKNSNNLLLALTFWPTNLNYI